MVALCACGTSGPEQRYELSGKVVEVDQKGGTVTISHDRIEGYMEPMTMPFRVKDGWALNEIKAGDRITAVLVVSGDRSWLEEIVFAREEPDPDHAKTGMIGRPGETVPNFSLINQDGEAISITDYAGRTLLLTFIYTRCPLPDFCPLITDRFSEIFRVLKSEPVIYANTRLLSISIDPEYDTPPVLSAYGSRYTTDGRAADFTTWQFASGTMEQVRSVSEYFGLNYYQEGDQIVHALSTALVSPEGTLVKIYPGNDWSAAQVLSDLRKTDSGGLAGKGPRAKSPLIAGFEAFD